MAYRIFLWMALWLLAFLPDSQAQMKKWGWGLESNYHFGKVFAHNDKFNADLIKSFAHLAELNVVAQTTGSQYWHQLHNYPQMGISFLFAECGNPEELGQGIGIIPNLSYTITNNKVMRLHFTLGLGAASITKPFDIISNPENNVIGSHINNITQFRFGINWKLSGRLQLNTLASYTHFSNGRYKLPNLGINIPTFGAGLRYWFQPVTEFQSVDSLPPLDKKLRYKITYGMAFQEFKLTGGPRYPIHIGSFYVMKNTGLINRLFAGIATEYRVNTTDFLIIGEIEDENLALKSMNASIVVGDELLVGNLGISGQFGFYIYYPYLQPNFFFNKLAVDYYFDLPLTPHSKYFVGVYLKSHFAVADYIQLATGLVF